VDRRERVLERRDRAFRRGLGSPALFAISYTSVASAVYFSLGVIAEHALGMTPFVFLAAGVAFALAIMTYVEGASLHQDRAGSTVFARFAFNEAVSFVAGWAILLDYTILIAITALSATHYLAAFWSPIADREGLEIAMALGIILYVAVRNVRGFSRTRVNRIAALVVADLVLQAVIIVLGLLAFFDLDLLLSSIDLGTYPTWDELVFALGVATVVFTGLESAAGLSGEVAVGRRGLRRLVTSATAMMMTVYVGIAVVAMTALPAVANQTSLARNYLEAPVLGIAASFDQDWLADGLTYVIAAAATATLVAASNSAMLGLSRLAYSLATNRQIPGGIGRLHPTRSTPYMVIGIAAVLAAALVLPLDIDFLVGIFAFGALMGLTIAHASIVVLRFREPDRPRVFRIPFNVTIRGVAVPLPAVAGAVLGALTWISVVATHEGARVVGAVWVVGGLLLYVVHRTNQGLSLTKRITVPPDALRPVRGARATAAAQYGSILVPILGTVLDDDIMQTAGRLAAEEDDEAYDDGQGATIEAVWVFEVPMSLPIDARLPEAQVKRARAALARAKAIGEEYEGVEVATATVRARRAGAAIVEEARRRGVQAIVLAAEEPTKVRGGALLGGRAGSREDFVGEFTKHVVTKAPCQVILTAPPAGERPAVPDGVPAAVDGDGRGS
jgi:APA family basic amino acid/polyamine antiporter